MKVSELQAKLLAIPPDTQVMVYNDHCCEFLADPDVQVLKPSTMPKYVDGRGRFDPDETALVIGLDMTALNVEINIRRSVSGAHE